MVIPERQATFRLSRGPSGVIGVISLQRPGAMRGFPGLPSFFYGYLYFQLLGKIY